MMNSEQHHMPKGGWIAAVVSALGAAVFFLWQPFMDYFITGTYDDNVVVQIDAESKQMVEILGKTVQKSDILADKEVIELKGNEVQSLDMGRFIYARKLIDSNALVAFMSAKKGTFRIRGHDAVISFSMNGFKKTIDRIAKTRCG